jgi:hypothetical protein
MEKTLSRLQARFPQLRFVAGKHFSWSPEAQEIVYDSKRSGKKAIWSLLHETGHALLDHKNYLADFELVRLEMAAWAKARELATDLQIKIDEDHIQDCLDTYRDWLYKRSICPHCHTKCLQQNDFKHYRCHNCHTVWRVTPSRFARAYRSTKNLKPTPVFHLTDSSFLD